MKKLAKAVAVIGTIGLAGSAFAVNPATFDITVDMAGSVLSVAIAGGPVALGSVAAGLTYNNGSAVVVTNDSTGLVEDYTISVANSAGGWSIAAAAAMDVATLHVKFNNAVPGNAPLDGVGNFDADDGLIGGAAASPCGDLAVDGAFAGDMDGWMTLPAEANNLWIRFGAPTGDSTGLAQSFTVTINAVAH